MPGLLRRQIKHDQAPVLNLEVANRNVYMARGESGQTLVEYALIVAGMTVGIVATMGLFRIGVSSYYDTIISAFNAVV